MKRQKSMIRTLTNRSFKANKTRNLVAIFAIVLTTVMFTSLFVLSQSMVENLRNMNFQQAGYNSHLSSGIMTDADVEKITTHEAVRDFGKSIVVGIAENKELTGRQVEIRYADENYALNKIMEKMGLLIHYGNGWGTTDAGAKFSMWHKGVLNSDSWHPELVDEIAKFLKK